MRRAARATLLLAVVGGVISGGSTRADGPPSIVKRVGRVTITVDARHGRPGGLLVVRLLSRGRLGAANAILDGRRLPFLRSGGGPRALVPVGVTSPPGPATLGVEIFARRGRQRVPVEITLAPSEYAPRSAVVPASRRELLGRPAARRDGRRLLQALRSLSSEPLAAERFLSPVDAAPSASFGSAQSYVGVEAALGARVEELFDSIAGAYHRGLDYDVAPETPVRAPAAGRVVLAAPLTLTGWTVVVDHGENVASAMWHLSAAEVVEGQRLRAGDALGRSGDTGLSAFPHLHWGVYVHAVAVDPRVFLDGLSD